MLATPPTERRPVTCPMTEHWRTIINLGLFGNVLKR